MVKHIQTQAESLYGLPQPTVNQFPTPIVARRAPTTSDTGYILGQVWVDKLAGTASVLVSNAGGVATWLSIGGTFNPAFATVTSAGNIISTAGNITATAGNIVSTLGNITATQGNITATLGNLTVTNGNVTIGTAGNLLRVKSGANGIVGTTTLVAGTKAIAIASIDANTRVFLSRSDLNASPAIGFLVSDTSVAGTLTINSLDATGTPVATDVSKVNYICVQSF